MSKVLTTAKNYLDTTESLRQAFLVSIELPGEEDVFIYLTDYFRDIIYKGNNFSAGSIKRVGDVKQTKQLSVYRLPVQISGAINSELNRVLDSKSFLNRKINIVKVFLDDDGEIIPVYNNNDSITYYEGVIVSSKLDETTPTSGKGRSTVTWNCASRNYALDAVTGRLTDDESHRGLVSIGGVLKPSAAAKRPEYQLDKGFLHANQSVKLLAEYQTQEKRYRMKKRKAGGFRGMMGQKHYSMEEYWADVVKEVDMSINLTAKYLPVVYGVQKVPGIPIFIDTDNTNSDEVWAVYAFCEGEIDGFLDVYFGDSPMICVSTDDSNKRACIGMKRYNGDTMGKLAPSAPQGATSNHGQHYVYNDGNGDIDFWTFHGKPYQDAAPVLVDMASKNKFKLQNTLGYGTEYWDDSFKLLDTSYIIVKYTLNDSRTDLPQIAVELQGKKVEVHNKDGSTNSNRTSLNLAWQTLDYLRSDIYGAGISINDIDLDSVKTCASYHDIIDTSYQQDWVPYWRYLGWESLAEENRQILQGSAMISTSDSVFKNTQALIAQFDGSLNIVQGKYTLTMEAEAPSVADISSGDIIGGSLSLSDTSMDDKYNSVQASILDPASGWDTTTITFYDSQYKKEDNNKEKKANISFPYITNYYTARSRAEYSLRKSRYARRATFELPFKFLWLYPNANITLTHARYGWDKKKFICQDVTHLANGKVRVIAREYEEGVFINSPQVDVGDEQAPIVTIGVLPPRNLTYVPDRGDAKVGLNGSLTWLPSLTKNIAYYTIRYTGKIELLTLIVDGTEPPNDVLEKELYNLKKGQYTFEVRAITRAGETSLPAKLVVDVDSSKVLPLVPDFKLDNPSTYSNKVFVGSNAEVSWSQIPDADLVTGLGYELQILNENDDIIRTLNISGTSNTGYNFSYTHTMNKGDYNTIEQTLGVYRNLGFKIRAVGSNGESSIDWTTL